MIGPAVREGLRARGFSAEALADDPLPQSRSAFATLATVAGEMLARPDGPRIAALEIGGWDTHAAQAPRLKPVLEQLDAGLAALKTSLGPAWKDTVVLTMTEFGRTVRVNGTKGTDHGTASVAFVLVGAVAGGRVAGTWPGLGPGNCLRTGTCSRQPIFARWRKGCWRSISGSAPCSLLSCSPPACRRHRCRGWFGLKWRGTGSREGCVPSPGVLGTATRYENTQEQPKAYTVMPANAGIHLFVCDQGSADGRIHGHDDVYVHLRWRIDPDAGSLSRNRERQRE